MNPDSTKKTDRGLKSTFVVVSEIAKLIAENTNGRALLVGGCVRDKLLNRGLIKDYDMEVFGVEPSTLKSLIEKHYEVNLVGDSFGVLKIKHYNIDIAIPRKERKIGDGHKAFETYSDPNMTLEEAASRRDFTINAIYFDPLDYSFKDPFGGIKDLKEKRLHIVSERFKEDPLRVLRGMQFIARFGLTPTGETISMCRSMTMEGLSRERIYDEFRKLFILGKNIGDGLAFLTATNWDSFFPGMKSAFMNWNSEKMKRVFSRYTESFGLRTFEEDIAVGFSLLTYRNTQKDDFIKMVINNNEVISTMRNIEQSEADIFNLCNESPTDTYGITSVLKCAYYHKNIAPTIKYVEALYDLDCRHIKMMASRFLVLHHPQKPYFSGKDLMKYGIKPGVKFGKILERMMIAQINLEFQSNDNAIAFFEKNREWLTSELDDNQSSESSVK